MTPWSIASAQKLAAACPRLLELPELPGTDPLQAWSTWNRLVALGPRPQVLEVGQGPWTTVLAVMACTLGGGLRTLGTDPTDAERLRADFARLGIADRCHVDTVDLADAEVGDRRTRFPDLAGLPPDAAFELVWVATPRAVPEQDCLDHVLPVVSSHLSPRGFDVVLEAPERPAAEQAAAFWDRLTDSAFTIATDALHGTGMLVSGRPDGAAADRSRPGPVLAGIRIPATIRRPVLTLPEDESREVARQYASADTILEYGSGGSTVLAAEMAGKTIFSVESDPRWLCRLGTYLQASAPASMAVMYYADIGATGDWGRPTGNEGRANYPDYSAGIWQQEFFRQPEVVLIDGRFRPACFLVCAALTKAPVTVLFDDYADRPHYHYVEAVVRPSRMVGRMAVFELAPGDFSDAHRPLLDKALYEPE